MTEEIIEITEEKKTNNTKIIEENNPLGGSSSSSTKTPNDPKGLLTLQEAFGPLFGLLGMSQTGNIFKDFGLISDALEDEKKFARSLFEYIFDEYDVDGNGAIDSNELGLLIKDIGEATGDMNLKTIPNEILKEMMNILDTDGNGTIEKDEFIDYMVGWLKMPSSDEEDEDSDTDN